MLFTKDAVLMIGRLLANRMVAFPDREWQRSGLMFALDRIADEAKREGYPVVTAANVIDIARTQFGVEL